MGPDSQTHTIVLASGCVCVVLWDYRQCSEGVLLYLGMVKDSHDNLELTQLTDRMTVRRYSAARVLGLFQ